MNNNREATDKIDLATIEPEETTIEQKETKEETTIKDTETKEETIKETETKEEKTIKQIEETVQVLFMARLCST